MMKCEKTSNHYGSQSRAQYWKASLFFCVLLISSCSSDDVPVDVAPNGSPVPDGLARALLNRPDAQLRVDVFLVANNASITVNNVAVTPDGTQLENFKIHLPEGTHALYLEYLIVDPQCGDSAIPIARTETLEGVTINADNNVIDFQGVGISVFFDDDSDGVTNIQALKDGTFPCFKIGGNISGLNGSLVLQNGPEELEVKLNGEFSFSTLSSNQARYDVMILRQPESQQCVVSDARGEVDNSNISTVGVNCTDASAVESLDLRFYEGKGVVTKDWINQHEAIVHLARWDAGYSGYGLSFNNKAYVTMRDRSSFDVTTALTIEAWVKPGVALGRGTIISKNFGRLERMPFYLGLSEGKVEFVLENIRYVTDFIVPFNELWVHLALSWDGEVARLYSDGEPVWTGQHTQTLTPTNERLILGAQNTNGTGQTAYFTGSIDEIKLWRIARTPIDICENAGKKWSDASCTAFSWAPVAEDSAFRVIEDSEYVGNFHAWDSNGDMLTYSIESSPSNATVTVVDSENGVFRYQASPGFSGTDSFTFKVHDGNQDSNTATVSVNVAKLSAYTQDLNASGLVVMEAENADIRTAGTDGHEWYNEYAKHYSGEISLRTGPEKGSYIPIFETSKAPRLSFNIYFEQAGTYYLWTRGSGFSSNSDDTHIGLNGHPLFTITHPKGGNLNWRNGTNTGSVAIIEIKEHEAGFIHTLDVWMADELANLDKLLLSQLQTLPGQTATESDRAESPAPLIQYADAPVISPRGGVFKDSAQISLSTETPGATIYYTVDGTEPVPAAANVYNGTPINLTTSSLVKAIAVKSPLANSLTTSASFSVMPTSPTNKPTRVSNGLVALYEINEGSGDTINDSSGLNHDALHLSIADPNSIEWVAGGISIIQPTLFQSKGNVDNANQAIKHSNEFTIEAWVRPANTLQVGPARIVSISENKDSRNATLGQAGTRYDQRVRTNSTNNNGMRPEDPTSIITPKDVAHVTGHQHVVFTRDSLGDAKIYVDGKEIINQKWGGDFSNWTDAMPLVLVNEIGGSRPWLGELYLVAIFSRALSEEEVITNWKATSEP